MIKRSVIPKDKSVDLRSERERKAYAAAQAFNRQVYTELQEFTRMKEVLGRDMPYKTLGGFRRAKRADSQRYEEVKKLYYEREPIKWKMQRNRRYDTEQYEKIKAILGDEAPKDVAELQDLKYNDKQQYKLIVKKAKLYSETRPENLLPNYDKAFIPKGKLKDYALNPQHERGKDKAKLYDIVLGYNQDNYKDFENILLKEIKQTPISFAETIQWGERFNIIVIVKGLKNKYMQLKTVWQIDKGKKHPHLITVSPWKKEG